jgi:hypothetical protein
MARLRKDDTQNLKAPGDRHREHPLFTGAQSVGMISGEAPKFPSQVQGGHEAMGEALKQLGLKHEERQGRYGAPEKSYMVYGANRDQMHQLGKQFGQESVVYSQGGKHELLYTNGPNAGRFHPALDHEWFDKEPEDYYTHMPEHGGYLRLNFDWDTLHPANLSQDAAVDALQTRAGHGQPPQAAPVAKSTLLDLALELDEPIHSPGEIRRVLVARLRKALEQAQPLPHPHGYDWHNDHTDHHLHVVSPGVVLRRKSLAKALPGETQGQPVQSPGSASNYAKHAMPFGTLDPGSSTDLLHYPYHGKSLEIDRLIKDHGYTTYYGGGAHGRPDLATRNYNTKHLMVPDPGHADTGHEAYTDAWRKMHELSHALVQPDLDKLYGTGRRQGSLGAHRTLREGLRAVHGEHLAAHKQRELSQQIGVNIPDHVFHRELNTIMHDAVHRVVTGSRGDPGGKGFRPHEHKVPVETALGLVRESAHNLGISGMHDLTKTEGTTTMADEKLHEPQEWRQSLAKAVKERVDAYSQELLALRQRELKKNLGADPALAGPAPEMTPMDACPLCGQEDVPGKCMCLQGPLAGPGPAPAMKAEKCADCGCDPCECGDDCCKDCGKKDCCCAKKSDVMGDPKSVIKPPVPKAKISKAEEPKKPKRERPPVKCGACGETKPWEVSGANMCDDCFDKKGVDDKGVAKKELDTKGKEPIKPTPGNGVKVKKLSIPGLKKALGDPAPNAGSRGGAPRPKLPGTGAKPQYTGAMHAQAKAALGGGPKIGAAPAAPKAGGLPGAAPKPPAPGVGTLKSPPGAGAAPAAPKIPGAPKPAAAGAGGAPKAAPAAAALPKPAAAKAPAAPSPGSAPGAANMGKTEKTFADLKKTLGNCPLCSKEEHLGQCS